MLNNLHNTTSYQPMEFFEEIDDPHEILLTDRMLNIDKTLERYRELQEKYSSLHEAYAREMENSNKVKKSLGKCLKLYSKIYKKYEAQQKIIEDLQENIKQKMGCLEESLQNQEKMKGLLDVYKMERVLYSGRTNQDLRKEKEILLNICCKLISESIKTTNIKNLTNLILKKFKKDLDEEKLSLLKGKDAIPKKESKVMVSELCSKLIDIKTNGSIESGCRDKSEEKNDPKEDRILREVKNTQSCEAEKVSLRRCDGKLNSGDSIAKENEEEIFGSESQKIIEEISFALPLLEDVKLEELSPDNKTDEHVSVDIDAVKNESDCKEIVPKNSQNFEVGVSADAITRTMGKKSENYEKILEDEKRILKNSRECISWLIKQNAIEEIAVGPVAIPNEGEERCRDNPSGITNRAQGVCAFSKSLENPLGCVSALNKQNTTEKVAVGLLSIPQEIEEVCGSNSGSSLLSVCAPSKQTREGQRCEYNLEELENPNSFDLGKNGGFESADKTQRVILENHSIFDIPPEGLNMSVNQKNSAVVSAFERRLSTSSENSLSISFEVPTVEKESCVSLGLNCDNNVETNSKSQELDDTLWTINSEKELQVIFEKMSTVKCLSPIRDVESKKEKKSQHCEESCSKFESKEPPMVIPTRPEALVDAETNGWASKKRTGVREFGEVPKKPKRIKRGSMCDENKQKHNGGLLDSIMSAMSIQNEEFKGNITKETLSLEKESIKVKENQNGVFSKETISDGESLLFSSTECRAGGERRNLQQYQVNECSTVQTFKNTKANYALEKAIMEEIQKFASSTISSKEEADRNVKACVAALIGKSEEVIAKVIVAIVLENIDEEVEMYERPAPPLTRTQHRIMILLSVFKSLDSSAHKITNIIQSKIIEKLFPDKFYWPDDSVETACRFFAALCKTRNDTKGLWRFCLQAMSEMKQRCCLVVFTVLKTWPDALHDAYTLKNNILAVTIVNIFLHMPITDGLRNLNQKKKLMALKHLLINFYQFKVEETIESHAEKVVEAVLKDEAGSDKSLILLTKCRAWSWTSKYILPKLKDILSDFSEGKLSDSIGNKVLSTIREMCSVFPQEDNKAVTQVKTIIVWLTEILVTRKLNHEPEQIIIEILLKWQYHPEARKAILEWVPKCNITKSLRNDIINISVEDVLQKMKRQGTSEKKKLKKKLKTGKGKRKKGKKGKRKKNGGKGNCKNVNSAQMVIVAQCS